MMDEPPLRRPNYLGCGCRS